MAETSTGLRQVDAEDWLPGPFCDIAIISTTIAALAAAHGFAPHRVVEDGLGWVSYIPLQLDDGTRFVFSWGEAGNPEQVSVRANITDRPYGAAIDKLLAALGLDRSVVLWLSDDDGYIHLMESLKREDKS